MTRGFDMPASTVLLLSSPSHAVAIGAADYAAEFVTPLVCLGMLSWG
jgi:hypothetical protein